MPKGAADEKQSIRMIADRLLVVPSKEAGERKSRAGILIPATADVSRRLVWAEVVAAGDLAVAGAVVGGSGGGSGAVSAGGPRAVGCWGC